MVKTDYDEAQTELTRAIQEDAPFTFEEPIPVQVFLDNGVTYVGDGAHRQFRYWCSGQLHTWQVNTVETRCPPDLKQIHQES